jgi:hypothetical protein
LIAASTMRDANAEARATSIFPIGSSGSAVAEGA